jgi:hypothetical protein
VLIGVLAGALALLGLMATLLLILARRLAALERAASMTATATPLPDAESPA